MAETLISGYLGAFTVKVNPAYAIERHVAAHGVWEPETVHAIGACVACFGGFVPTAYPDYGLNTLAVHPSRAAWHPLVGVDRVVPTPTPRRS